MSAAVLPAEPLSEEQTRSIAEEFFRTGSAHVPNVLTPDEIAELRARTDAIGDAPESVDPKHISYVYDAFVLRFGHEADPIFASMVTRQPIYGLVEAVLGKGARFNALNVIRNQPGQAISRWHVDDVLEHSLPEEIARFDPRIRMPVLWLTVQVALSDIDSLEHGPTQFVPESHYSGRYPVSQENPTFEGHGPVSMFCKAGDIYFTNHQCWHRGAPNISDRTRYVMQLQYAAGWADRRFRGVA
jgi:hypothetical protein